jgi:hypothetical protein
MNDDNATPNNQIVVMPTPASPIATERSGSSRPSRRTIFDLTPDEFNRLQFLSEMYAQSSFNNSKTPKKKGDYFLIMMKGIEVGLTPMAAVENIDIINGEPVIDGKGILGLIYASSVVEKFEIDATKERCIITAKRVGHAEQIISFTKEDAQNFKTFEWKDNKRVESSLWDKPTWKAQPEVMLMWRCVTKTGRRMFSDVISNLYTKDEMESTTFSQADDSLKTPANPVPALSESTIPVSQDKPVTKAWHEDLEELKTVLGHCKGNGWIQGDTIGKLKESFHSLLKKPIIDFETSQAAIEAADAEIKSLWAAKAKPEEAAEETTTAWDTLDGIAVIVNWAKGKGFGEDESALLKLLGVEDWKVYPDGRAACKAIEAAFKAKPADSKATDSKKAKLSDIDLLAINTWAMDSFNLSASQLADKMDLSKFTTITTAKTVIKQKAREEGWAVVSETCTYEVKEVDGKTIKYISFDTVLGEIRYYPGRREFAKLVGEPYATDNGITDLPANEDHNIDPVLLTWKAQENYNQVVDAMPIGEFEPA